MCLQPDSVAIAALNSLGKRRLSFNSYSGLISGSKVTYSRPTVLALCCIICKMPAYKVIYGNAKGRAETIRFIFAQAGVPYEDKRLTGEEWAQLKPTFQYGALPVLEVDGKQLAGSGPIARFLAERFGLAGSSDFENAEIASIDDVIDDLAEQILRCMKDETRKADLKKALQEKHLPRYLGALEKRASASPEGWLWGTKLTWPDFHFYNTITLSYLKTQIPDLLKSYPALTKLKISVETLPNIAKWIKERPQTEY